MTYLVGKVAYLLLSIKGGMLIGPFGLVSTIPLMVGRKQGKEQQQTGAREVRDSDEASSLML